MQISKKIISPTQVSFQVSADADELASTKQTVLKSLSRNLKLQGFRAGKAPMSLVEKNVEQSVLQTEFLDQLMNNLWNQLLSQEAIRPVSQPKVNLTKFVPFTTVEAEYEVTVVGDMKLPDYKKFRLAKPAAKVNAKGVDEVLQNLRGRAAEKTEVKRAAKDDDEVTIDFAGKDAKTGEAISGTDGKNYSLVLGSNTFIPGFEPELVGLKAGDDKTFTITFP